MLPPIPSGWNSLLRDEIESPRYRELDAFLDAEAAAGHTILPARENIFNALALTPLESVRVVLLGQDPYPTPGHAHGLCFSVQPGVRPLPGSLRNVFKELETDLGCRIPNNGCLESWARQGLLLLNTLLTVRAGEPNAHQRRGWEPFTDRIIQLVDAKPDPVVFLLWGASAHKKADLVTGSHHRIVRCAHPSPLSARKFFGCRCFSETNRLLAAAGRDPVDWQIPDVHG